MNRHYTIAEYNEAMELLKLESNMMEVSRQTGIKWSTIKTWRNGKGGSHEAYNIRRLCYNEPKNDSPIEYLSSLNPLLDDETRNAYYSFILGLYLGDGYIAKNHTLSLLIYLDKKYDKLNKYVSFIYEELFGRPAHIIDRATHKDNCNCLVIKYTNKYLGFLFPHLGVGMKHLRKIELQEWQKQIINPIELVKGLMFSDGCFYYNKSSGVYCYSFTNCSSDIINILTDSLNVLNIKHTVCIRKGKTKHISIHGKEIENRATARNVNIYSMEAVKRLHSLIGDKNNPIVITGLGRINEVISEYQYEFVDYSLNLRDSKNKTIEQVKELLTCVCGNAKNRYANKCIKCANIEKNTKRMKFEVGKEELELLVSGKPISEIGRMFGVTGNTIRKRCKRLGVEY